VSLNFRPAEYLHVHSTNDVIVTGMAVGMVTAVAVLYCVRRWDSEEIEDATQLIPLHLIDARQSTEDYAVFTDDKLPVNIYYSDLSFIDMPSSPHSGAAAKSLGPAVFEGCLVETCSDLSLTNWSMKPYVGLESV
jgi:hypothetical protein